jgi:ketosteroid isomerase-like protein
MRRIDLAAVAFVSLAAVTFVTAPAARADNASVEKEVMDTVAREWAAEMKGDVDGMLKSKSKDITMFDLGNPYRTDYTVDNTIVRAETKPGAIITEHMINPKVQVYGDIAILTYNFVGLSKGSDGKLWHDYNRATRIYHKENGQWMWVHGHFSRATPEP